MAEWLWEWFKALSAIAIIIELLLVAWIAYRLTTWEKREERRRAKNPPKVDPF